MPNHFRYEGQLVEYSRCPTLTTLDDVPIPETSGWPFHPQFLIALSNRLGMPEGTHPNTEQIERWIQQHWDNIRRSSFSSFLIDGLSLFIPRVSSRMNLNDLVFPCQNKDRLPIRINTSGGSSRPTSAAATVLIPRRSDGALERDENIPVVFSGVYFNPDDDSYYLSCVPSRNAHHIRAETHPWNCVMNYSYVPRDMPFLSCDKERTYQYFGMELEMSTVLGADELQRINEEVEPRRERWFYFKQDSSVSGRFENRIEMVTVPMTPKRMKQEWKIFFKKINDLRGDHNLRMSELFDMSNELSNGIHIHISKEAFYQAHPRDNRHKFRFLTAFNQWETAMQDWLQKISKRPTALKDNRYCYIHPGLDGYTLARRLRNGPQRHDRHAACHEGGATVEVRIFQGIPELDHILSCIQMTEAMFEYTAMAPHSAFGAKFAQHFSEYVFSLDGYKQAKEVLAQCV